MYILSAMPDLAQVPDRTAATSADKRDGGEGFGFQAGTALERAVDVRFGDGSRCIVCLDRTAVLDAHGLGGGVAVEARKDHADVCMDRVGILGCGGLARPDGPDWFVGDRDALERRGVDAFGRTVIMATHAANAASIADRIVFLKDGRIELDEDRMTRDAIYDTIKDLEAPR